MRTMSFRVTVAIVTLVLLGGCESPESSSTQSGMSFADEAEALAWIAQRSEELQLGEVERNTDTNGVLVGLRIKTEAAGDDVREREKQLLEELGGDEGFMEIGDTLIPLGDQTGEESGSASTKLAMKVCGGSFCTDDWSFKNNYWLYRSIGSQTDQVSGGYRVINKFVCGSKCPDGYTLKSMGGFGCNTWCQKPEGSNYLQISNTYYNFASNGLLLPAWTGSGGAFNSTSLEVKEYEWGTGGGFVADLDGVCGVHTSWGDGGSSSSVTRAGSVPDDCR